MPGDPAMMRIRLVYKKGEALKYTGHLDLHKVWERSIRRSQLPLVYSQGFHPQPRIQQACPLPLGFTSNCEMIDLWLRDELTSDLINQSLTPALPPGIELTGIKTISLSDPPLQTIVCSSEYLAILEFNFDMSKIETKIQEILSSASILRERRGKPYDLRILIHQLRIVQSPEPGIFMRLSALPGATGRPEEVLNCLGIEQNQVTVVRLRLIFIGD
jgi:radical SAM-linked protein